MAVWVELWSETPGTRLVRADTVEQVWWDVKQPAFLTLTLHSGQEVRQDARAWIPTGDLEEDEAGDLCTTLVEHIAQATDEDGPRMVWMARNEDTKGVWWKHGPLIDRSAR